MQYLFLWVLIMLCLIINAKICTNATFPIVLDGQQCWGLSHGKAKSMSECVQECCDSNACTTWQWCDNAQECNIHAGDEMCWIGVPTICKNVSGWISRGGRAEPSIIQLPSKVPPATPLPQIGTSTDPRGNKISVDSVSLKYNDNRWLPVGGEIHPTRLTAAEWREQLLRMQAGGLDVISVYVVWIHHEEREGQWNFTGRKNLNNFIQLANEVGFKVILRIGPWDHGELRNGGHPDWLLEKSKTDHFKLRNNNTQYLKYVNLWYQKLGIQFKGFFFKDGGPIIGVQLDNETPDWRYLLALRQIALAASIDPPAFIKTGWPTPSTGYPKDYPMLPFYGGYADKFWNNDMHPTPSTENYFFKSKSPSPEGYPWLTIEVGGGMAAAYNHRVHMSSEDMPSMHLVDLGSGANGLGYYMYHGGNNPHSINGDAPEAGLQESSFMPAGAQNPMPSQSYDFFAPLGEFGQVRRHYHQMRLLHMFVLDFGSELAAMPTTLPVIKSALRWSVRSDTTTGFIFVSNYQRLSTLPPQKNVSFQIKFADGHMLQIPNKNSSAVTVDSNVWFHWPFNLDIGSGIRLRWATVQVVGRTEGYLIVVATRGVSPELAIETDKVVVVQHHGKITYEDGCIVLRNIEMGTSASIILRKEESNETISVIVLPHELATHLWLGNLAGKKRFFIGDSQVILSDGNHLRIRSNTSTGFVSVLPPPKSMTMHGVHLDGHPDGVFMRYAIQFNTSKTPDISVELIKEAGPPRAMTKARSGKAREPNTTEWKAAAVYNVSLNMPLQSTELRLAVHYKGDAARFYYKGKLLTDNWWSGYTGDGEMEVGLSYLAAENMMSGEVTFELHILPLSQDSLNTVIFIQKRLWPDFAEKKFILELTSIEAKQLFKGDIICEEEE